MKSAIERVKIDVRGHLCGPCQANPEGVKQARLTPCAIKRLLLFPTESKALVHLLRINVPVGVQQKLMRHANVATTMNIYGNSTMRAKQEANSKVVQMVMKQNAA